MPPNGGIIAKSRKPQENLGSCRTMHPRPPFSLCSFWPYSLVFSVPPSSFLLPALAPQTGDEMHLLHIQYVLRCGSCSGNSCGPAPACLLASCSCLLLYLAASAVGLSWRTAELMLGDAATATWSTGHVRGPRDATVPTMEAVEVMVTAIIYLSYCAVHAVPGFT